MKKTFLLLAVTVSILACKNETKNEAATNDASKIDLSVENNGIKLIKGEFIYYADAAVLQTPTEVYGVIIDSMMHVLQEQVKTHKKEPTDMVPVAIKAKVIAKDDNEEGWPYNVEILEIIKVYKPQPESNNVIKLEKQTK